MLSFWVVLMLPLSLLRSMGSLACSSFLGVAAIMFLVFATGLHCVVNRFIFDWDCAGTLSSHGNTCNQDLNYAKFDSGMVTALPLVMFAFTCQVNVYDIYRELKHPSEAKMMRISWLGMFGICLVVYASMGIFGYLDFLGTVQGNILVNLRYDVGHSAIISTAFVAITLTIVSAYPLVVFPCRESIFSILRAPKTSKDRDRMIEQHRAGVNAGQYVVGPGARLTTSVLPSPPNRDAPQSPVTSKPNKNLGRSPASPKEEDSDDSFVLDLDEPLLPHTHLLPSLVLPSHDLGAENYYVPPVPTRVYMRPPAWQHYLVSLCISVSAIVTAVFVPNIQVVFSLLGGICSSFLCFVFPAACVKRLGCCTAESVGVSGMVAIEILYWGGAAAGLLSTAYTVYSTFCA